MKKDYITPEIENISMTATETWPAGTEGSIPPPDCFSVAPTVS
jgi:hypothetical protein